MSTAPHSPAATAEQTEGSAIAWVALPILVFLLVLSGCSASPPADARALKLLVSERGMYRLDRSELQKAGLRLGSGDLDKIRLTHRGSEIPI
ncbi:MAG: hypothetical protein ACM3JD_01615, partial [Rudaea sp.]